MWGAPVFEEKNALPRSELHFLIHNRNCLTSARRCHSDMRRHIIAALGTVRKVIHGFGHKPIEKLFQVAARGRIGILHYDNAATGVLNEDSHCPVPNSALVDLRLHILCDFVQALAVRAKFEAVVINVHEFQAKIPCGKVIVAPTC